MALDPITIGLLAGLGKDVLIDGPKERAQYEYEAQRALASPWYGMNDQGHKQSTRGDAIMQGLGAGLYSKATESNALPGGKTNESVTPSSNFVPPDQAEIDAANAQAASQAPAQSTSGGYFSPQENMDMNRGFQDNNYMDLYRKKSPYNRSTYG